MKKNNIHTLNLRRSLLASAVIAGMGATSVQAIEIDVGNDDYVVRFDNTFKYNYGVRTESADQRILNTPNSNDGNFNFRRSGTNITNRVDILSEFDVVYKESMGFRVSAAGWYDRAYENVGSNSNPFVNGNGSLSGLVDQGGLLGPVGGAPGTGAAHLGQVGNGSSNLSNYAQRFYTGPSGEILDAFVFYSTQVGDESLLSFKAGQSNSFWGETLLNPVHSMSYGQSGLDLAKLASSPGTEAKELFVPRNQLFSSFTLNDEWTFAGQYFLDWDAARLPEAGTYYGFSDVLGEGAQSFLLGNSTDGFIAADSYANVVRGRDFTPDDRGDWGVQAKWSPEWLDGTLGFYYRETSDILPQAYLTGTLSTLVETPQSGFPASGLFQNLYNSIASSSYGLAYGENIDIYGISLSKSFAGVSVGSDLNFRQNMPLASIPAVFGPSVTVAPALGQPPGTTAPGLCSPSTGVFPFGSPAGLPIGDRDASSGCIDGSANGNGFATGDTAHFVVNALTTFADTPVFDSAVWIAEVAYSNMLSLDSRNEALYKGQSTYRGIDAPDRDNLVFTTIFTPTWFQVFPGIDMTAPVALNVGVYGNSPVQGGGNEDTGSYSLGVGAQIYNKYFVDLKYVDAFGKTANCNSSGTAAGEGDGAAPNPFNGNQAYTCTEGGVSSFSGAGAAIEDRGAVYLTFKTTI